MIVQIITYLLDFLSLNMGKVKSQQGAYVIWKKRHLFSYLSV